MAAKYWFFAYKKPLLIFDGTGNTRKWLGSSAVFNPVKFLIKLSEIYQKFIRSLSEVYQKFNRNLSEFYQKIIRLLHKF